MSTTRIGLIAMAECALGLSGLGPNDLTPDSLEYIRGLTIGQIMDAGEEQPVPQIKPFQPAGVEKADSAAGFPKYIKHPSKSEPGVERTVVIYDPHGLYTACNCPHWLNRMTPCSHIKASLHDLGITAAV